MNTGYDLRISEWSSDVCFSDLFTGPNGFGMHNGTTAVDISGNGGQAQFSTGRYNGDMNAYIASVLKAIGGDANLTPGTIQRTTVNGIPAYYTTAIGRASCRERVCQYV